MDETEVIRVIREHLERFFPKRCANCGRRFASLKEYNQTTEYQGSVMPYDAFLGDPHPEDPLGVFAFSNCLCGNTLALGSTGMDAKMLLFLLDWANTESRKKGMMLQEFLDYLRDEISKQVLLESNVGKPRMMKVII